MHGLFVNGFIVTQVNPISLIISQALVSLAHGVSNLLLNVTQGPQGLGLTS